MSKYGEPWESLCTGDSYVVRTRKSKKQIAVVSCKGAMWYADQITDCVNALAGLKPDAIGQLILVAELADALGEHEGKVHGRLSQSWDTVPEHMEVSIDTKEAIEEVVKEARKALKKLKGAQNDNNSA